MCGETSLNRDVLLKMKVFFDRGIACKVDALEILIIAHNGLAMPLGAPIAHSALSGLPAELRTVKISVELRGLTAPLSVFAVRRNLVRGLSFDGYISILSGGRIRG